MNNIKKIVFVIMGTLIGAGFASGREIYLFFFRFGKMGIWGIALSSIMTGIIVYFTLKLAHGKEMDKYDELIDEYEGIKGKINSIIKIIVTAFLLISFYIMVAGFSAYIKQLYNISNYISSAIFSLIVYLILKKDMRGMVEINLILVPVILILIIILGIINFPYILSRPEIVANCNDNWIIYSILYSSYNSIILIPTIITLRKYICKKNEIIKVSILITSIMIVLLLCIFGLLIKGDGYANELEMPLLETVGSYGSMLRIIYSIVIIISIFTSAISVGYSFLENSSSGYKYNRNLIFICLSSIFISNIGFSTLVKILYPIFGIFGVIQLILIFKMNIKN